MPFRQDGFPLWKDVLIDLSWRNLGVTVLPFHVNAGGKPCAAEDLRGGPMAAKEPFE